MFFAFLCASIWWCCIIHLNSIANDTKQEISEALFSNGFMNFSLQGLLSRSKYYFQVIKMLPFVKPKLKFDDI